MKQVNSFRYWLVATLLLCLGMTAKAAPHTLTLKAGSDDHATITFKVGNTVVTSAEKEATVDINFAMKGNGWKVKDVKAIEYTSWDVAGARNMLPQSELKKDIVVKNENGKWSFTMPDYNVQVEVTYETSALTDAMIQKPIKDQDWTGSPITLSTGENGDLKVMDGSTLLIAGTDYEPSYENNTDPGVNTAKVTITGKNGYAGSTASANFSIIKTLSGDNVSCADQTYTGSKLETTVTVVDGSTTLAKGTDYDVTYPTDPTANINAGTGAGKVTVTFKGKYKGTVNATFNILPRSLQDPDVSKPTTLDAMTYTGSPLTPNLDGKITYNSMTLVQGADKDYTLTYANNTNVGEATITVSGKGNYKDDITVKFNITKAAPTVTEAPTAKTGLIYNEQDQDLVNGGSATGGKIQYSTDDGQTWQDAVPTGKDAGDYPIKWKVTGDDNHSDTEPQTLTGKIEKAGPLVVELTGVPKTYNGTEQSPDGVTVKAKSKDKNGNEIFLTVGTADYEVKGGDKGTDVGTYNYQVEAKSTSTNFKGTGEKEWAINKADLSNYTVELAPATFIYGGDEKQPAVTVKNGTKTVPASEYTVTYANNKNAGTATVTVKGKEVNYTGTATQNFTINPAPLTSVTLEKNELVYNPAGNTVKVTGVTAAGQTGNSATATTLTLSNDPAEWEIVSGNTGSDAGDYEVIVQPKASATNYTGTAKASWKIVPKNVSELSFELTGGPWTYNGTEQEPGVIVKDGENPVPTSEYTVDYDQNIEARKETDANPPVVIITGNDKNYTGTKTIPFTIGKSSGTVAVDPTEWETTYGQGDQTKQLTLTPTDLKKVQWLSGNTAVATVDNNGLVTVTGAGVTTIYALVLDDDNYVSSWALCEVTVKPQEITDVTVGAAGANGVPVLTAKNAAGETLAEGTDYELEYIDADEKSKTIDDMRKAPGKYTAVITFIGNYQGIVKKEITVSAGLMDSDDFIDGLLDGTIKTGPVTDDNKEYDINGDLNVDIADLQALMNLEAGLNIDGSKPGAARAMADTGIALMNVSTTDMGGGVTRYALSLEGGREFSAFMMDVVTTGSAMVTSEQAAEGVQLRSSTLAGNHRIIGLAEGSAAEGSVLQIDVMGNGSVSFENISFSTPGAAAFYVRMGDATGISLTNAAAAEGDVFGLGGQRQETLQKGVNIVRGQNGKSVKVLRK